MNARQDLSPKLVGLLALAMLLNYADRGSLSIAAPVLKSAFRIDNAAMGLVLSAFFWSYALSQPVAGWLTQRYPPRAVLAAGVALWALATMACGLANSLVMLIVMRVLLGIGESVIFPVNACIFSQAPERQRGRANGAIAIGSYLGPSIGTFAGGLILVAFGWRAIFWVLGGVTLLWLLPWLSWSQRLLGSCAEPHPDPARYGEILGQRSLWGASLGQFCYSYQFYFLLTWMPLYLVNVAHYSVIEMTFTAVALYSCQAIGAGTTGLVSDLLIASGRSPTLVRKGFLLAGLGGSGLSLTAIGLAPAMAMPLLVLSGLFTGLSGPMVFTIGQTLSGPRAGARWMGIQNMVGNFSGIAAPIVTGFVAQWSGSFTGAFLIAGSISAAGVGCWWLVVGEVKEVPWRAASIEATRARLAALRR